MDPKNFSQKVDWLIDRWCDRRALRLLRVVLPAYSGTPLHSGQLLDLINALQSVKALYRTQLKDDELECLTSAVNELEQSLKKRAT